MLLMKGQSPVFVWSGMRGSILSFGARRVNVISIPPVGFRSAGFVSGGQVKPGLSPPVAISVERRQANKRRGA